MFSLGWMEISIILIITVIVVGPKEIPTVIKFIKGITSGLGKISREFKSTVNEISHLQEVKDIKKDILDTKDFKDNQQVNVVVRPEAIKLNVEKSPLTSPNSGVVVDSKFLGNSAIIHMTVNDSSNNKHHIHSKLIGEFLPAPASSVSFSLDLNHVFIFPR